MPDETVRVRALREVAEPVAKGAAAGEGAVPFVAVGALQTRRQTPGGDASAVLHDTGVPTVLADAGRVFRWRGARPTVWLVRQATHASLGLAPQDVAVFKTEAEALEAYAAVRGALLRAVLGLVARDALGDAPRLAPERARAEAFAQGDREVAWLSVDQGSDALALAAMTADVMAFSLGGSRSLGVRAVGATLQLAVRPSPMGVDGVLLADLGRVGPEALATLATGRWKAADVGNPEVALASGVALVFLGALRGVSLVDGDEGEAAVERTLRALAGRDAAALPMADDLYARGSTAYALRVRPGVYRVEVFRAEGHDGRCIVLTHAERAAWRPGDGLPGAVPVPEADPLVLPGTSHPRLSDYGRWMKTLRRESRPVALAAEGLDEAAADAMQTAWMKALLRDPSLATRLARWLG